MTRIITVLGIICIWAILVSITGVPPYILPSPFEVGEAFLKYPALIAGHGWITAQEVLAGFTLGALLGAINALALIQYQAARRWVMPLLIFSQAIPVFALAPLLTLWLGYGLWSKIVMTMLIIYFPVTAAFYDGLRRVEPEFLDLAQVMGASKQRSLWYIRVPAALPALGSGLKLAAVYAPIGAVVGEWVGASGGLGYLMLYANGRLKIDLMFAALITLAAFALLFHALIGKGVQYITRWAPDSTL